MKRVDTQMEIKPANCWECFVTKDERLIKQAMQLRYQVFAKEMGAKLPTAEEELDHDKFDDYCDHLIVYNTAKQQIAGYTRLLDQEQAAKVGGFYSQGEFNLDPVLALPGRFLEIGRTCIDPDFRGSTVLAMLWSGLMKYIQQGNYDHLIGCVSISPGPNGFSIDAVYRNIAAKNFAPPLIKVTPIKPLPEHLTCQRDESGIPPLFKAYLRFGVQVCGQPCWDEDFNVMDLFIILPLTQLDGRYSRYYSKPRLSAYDLQSSPAL